MGLKPVGERGELRELLLFADVVASLDLPRHRGDEGLTRDRLDAEGVEAARRMCAPHALSRAHCAIETEDGT